MSSATQCAPMSNARDSNTDSRYQRHGYIAATLQSRNFHFRRDITALGDHSWTLSGYSAKRCWEIWLPTFVWWLKHRLYCFVEELWYCHPGVSVLTSGQNIAQIYNGKISFKKLVQYSYWLAMFGSGTKTKGNRTEIHSRWMRYWRNLYWTFNQSTWSRNRNTALDLSNVNELSVCTCRALTSKISFPMASSFQKQKGS